MSTTITTNLSLIKPDDDESIKANLPTFEGWASQNGKNQDVIDSLFRMSTATYTLNWTASGGNPTLGTGGFTEGKWVRVFPRMVFVYFRIYTGTTGFLTGTGTYRINLPFAYDASMATMDNDFPVIGRMAYADASATATSSTFIANYSQGVSTAIFKAPVGGVWNDTTPVVPAQGDRMSGYFMYPTADA